MNRFLWFVSAALVLALSAVVVLLGRAFLPSSAAMQAKLGTLAPLVITWGMIGVTVVAGVILAGFLLLTGMRETGRA